MSLGFIEVKVYEFRTGVVAQEASLLPVLESHMGTIGALATPLPVQLTV